jgi:histidinol-phosphate phosphatase family protein
LVKISPSIYKVIIITNQSAVGRGIISLDQAEQINNRLVAEIRSLGGRIDGVYMCPHAPQVNCACRKPQPGLIEQAVAAHAVDIEGSILIGDALSDILAGQTAGVATNVLVLSGRGRFQSTLPLANQIPHFLTYNSLAEAVTDLIGAPNNDT